MVFAEVADGELAPISKEILGIGRTLADALGEPLLAAAPGSGLQQAARSEIPLGNLGCGAEPVGQAQTAAGADPVVVFPVAAGLNGALGESVCRPLFARIVLQLGDRVSERRDEVTTNWWVYMPRQRSRTLMDRKADELVQLGITDFIVLPEKGPWQYAISLGAFREEEGARDYLAELRDKGVRTGDIGRREQQVVQTTLIIRAPTPAESTQLVELATRFSGTAMRAMECES